MEVHVIYSDSGVLAVCRDLYTAFTKAIEYKNTEFKGVNVKTFKI